MQNFNVGDKVKVVKLDNRTWVEVRKRLGQIGKVIKSDLTDCQIEFADGKRFFFRYCELEKVEEDFKISEEVYINFANSDGLKLTNQKGQIIDSKNEMFLVQYFDGELDVKDSRYFYKKFVSKNPKEAFGVGEEVYVNHVEDGYNFVNEKVKINYISKFTISVKTKNGVNYNFDPKCISKQPINTKPNSQNVKMKTREQIDSEIKELEAKIQNLIQEKENSTFEVGDWFIVNPNGGCDNFKAGGIYEIVKIDGKVLVARFNETGNDIKRYNPDYARKATPAEIEKYLIKLAEESGLKVGGFINRGSFKYNIKSFSIYQKNNKTSVSCIDFIKDNKLKYGLQWNSFSDGLDLAYPFDYITYQKSKFPPKITINGYDAEFCVGYVKFGCAKFDNLVFTRAKEFIDQMNNMPEANRKTNRKVESIKLGAGVFTPTDIDNIVKQLKS